MTSPALSRASGTRSWSPCPPTSTGARCSRCAAAPARWGSSAGEGVRVILLPLLQVRILNRVSDLDVRQDGSLRNVPPVDVVTCLQDNKVTVDSE